jgi:hypothetical protein
MMDTNEIIAHSRARFEHAAAKKLLKEKYQSKLNFGWNGGMFRASPEMITFLSLYDDKQIVVQDLYENPVKVNAQELLGIMQARWQEQMNAWLIEYEELNKKR